MAPSTRVIIHHTWWKVDYTELLPSWKGKGFVLPGIDILDTVPSLYPMFLPNLPPGHLGLFCPLYQQAKKGNTLLTGAIDSDYQQKNGLLSLNGSMKE